MFFCSDMILPVIQDKENWQISDGQHKAIVSQELFDEAQVRRKDESTPFPRKRTDHVNLLTGLLVCPVCGRKMVATNTKGKVKKDGSGGKETHAYSCKYSKKAFGPDCTFTKQYRQELIDTIEIVPDADWKRGEGIVSKVRFKLPMIYGDKRTLEVDRQEDGNFKAPDKQVGNKYFRVTENTDESIVLMSRV